MNVMTANGTVHATSPLTASGTKCGLGTITKGEVKNTRKAVSCGRCLRLTGHVKIDGTWRKPAGTILIGKAAKAAMAKKVTPAAKAVKAANGKRKALGSIGGKKIVATVKADSYTDVQDALNKLGYSVSIDAGPMGTNLTVHHVDADKEFYAMVWSPEFGRHLDETLVAGDKPEWCIVAGKLGYDKGKTQYIAANAASPKEIAKEVDLMFNDGGAFHKDAAPVKKVPAPRKVAKAITPLERPYGKRKPASNDGVVRLAETTLAGLLLTALEATRAAKNIADDLDISTTDVQAAINLLQEAIKTTK